MRILFVVYDNGSYVQWFPLAVASLASVLRREGYVVSIYHQDVYHYSEEHLTNYLNKHKFDVVGVSIIAGYYEYRKLLKISDAINKSLNRPVYVIGGHGPSPEPEYFLLKTRADVAVLGEGEETMIELLTALVNNRTLKNIRGIAYREGEQVAVNERRPLIDDIDSIPFPAYDLFPIVHYRLLRAPLVERTKFLLPMMSGRGCTFECTFCYRLDPGFRPRSNESILDEIKLLKKNYDITYIMFGDDLLMSSPARTISLCEDFIRSRLNIKWNCNGRLNYAKPEVLQLMKKAGCVFINYGIESVDNEVLKNMKKGLTSDQIIRGVEHTLDVGIRPGLNIIFGNIGDNKDTLDKGVKFLLEYSDDSQMRTIRPVTPYPGSPLYYYAINNGLLKDCEDFYENKHTNSDLLSVNFTKLSDGEFYEALFNANKKLIHAYYDHASSKVIQDARNLYYAKDVSFRGFRQT